MYYRSITFYIDVQVHATNKYMYFPTIHMTCAFCNDLLTLSYKMPLTVGEGGVS